jgi:prepilin-type N-terminal cleavage/methylation domain-containing protein
MVRRGIGDRQRAGVTLIEIAVVMAIITVFTALAMPRWLQYQRDQQVRGAARAAANTLHWARSQALATGQNHIVYFNTGGADLCGNALQDSTGAFTPILVANDGAGGNCCFDEAAGERVLYERPVPDVNWGLTFALDAGGSAVAAPNDGGAGDPLTGTSFTEFDGATQASAILFGPDGVPVAFDNACATGETGSGNGAVYLTNGNRDYAIVLSPLGTVKVYRWDRSNNVWVN